MMPDKCSVSEEGKQCVNPPQFIVSIVDGKDEYMFGLTCQKHRHIVSGKLTILQNEGKMHSGKISFTPVKSVGTDCIHGDADDLVQIDLKKSN
ncbi:hypothetical protein OAJ36_00905 [Nitrosopumilus sp.]|jgi:hypothetical protein|nr:hypothetical protein [Nitrosopumilus sp.]MDC0242297.1 hypothetical protein [Nitrosopumilus sp.]